MLKLINIFKKIDKRIILHNINLEFQTTGIYVIKGESGSGKTSLLNIIAGIDKKYKGIIEVDNKIISGNNLEYIKKYISFCSNDYDLIDNITIKENFNILKKNNNYDEEELKSLLKEMNLEINLEEYTNELSGGQKKRLMIIKSLIEHKPITIFDEPTANLDEENKKIIWACLKKESENRLIIIATHDCVNDINPIIISSGVIENSPALNIANSTFNASSSKDISIFEKIYNKKDSYISKLILILNMILISFVFISSIKIKDDYVNIYDSDEYLLKDNCDDALINIIDAYDNKKIDSTYLGFVDFKAEFTYSLNSVINYCYDEEIAVCEKKLISNYNLICGEDKENSYVIGHKLADVLIKSTDNKISYNDLIGLPILDGVISGVTSKNTMCAYMDREVYSETSLETINNYSDIGYTKYEDYTIVYGSDASTGGYIVNADSYDNMTYEEIYNSQKNYGCVGVFTFNGDYKNKFSKLSSDSHKKFFNGNVNFMLYDENMNIVDGKAPNGNKEIIMDCYSGYEVGDKLFDYTIVGLYNTDEMESNIYATKEGLNRFEDLSPVLYAIYSNGYMNKRSDEIRYVISDITSLENNYNNILEFETKYSIAGSSEFDKAKENKTIYSISIFSFSFIVIVIILVNSSIDIVSNKKNIGVLLANGNRRSKVFLNYVYNNKLKQFINNLLILLAVFIAYLLIISKYDVLNLGRKTGLVIMILFTILFVQMIASLIPVVIEVNKNIISIIKSKRKQ